jgi:hypothetical protein
MLEHLRRVLDLAARYDYEYWLQQEMSAHAGMFLSEGAQDLLPADLRGQAPAVAVVAEATAASTAPIVDNYQHAGIRGDLSRLGPAVRCRCQTTRAREILCFIASRPHRRAPRTIIDTFWRTSI